LQAVYRDFRPGDIRHSLANIDRAQERLSYKPAHGLASGITASFDWYRSHLG
jgi:UDP-N-acetylglucosamine 4-epimerase